MLWWFVLAAFPVFIMAIIRMNAFPSSGHNPRIEEEIELRWRAFAAWMLFALVPMLVTMLGTLLWTTPAISAELERRSWTYLAVRPNGGTAVLLGKYLAAVTWVLPPALVGLTIAVVVAGLSDFSQAWQIWSSLALLALLSAPAYAAIYLFLGVVLPRRAMVLAVAYTLIFELVVSFIPAVINKITVQYRLRSLAAEWCDIAFTGTNQVSSTAMQLIGTEPAWQQILTLIIQTVTLLGLAIGILRTSEFSATAETDT
jgi:ABC-type transport system involved in multi-copper enzyme maturation permease subunit